MHMQGKSCTGNAQPYVVWSKTDKYRARGRVTKHVFEEFTDVSKVLQPSPNGNIA